MSTNILDEFKKQLFDYGYLENLKTDIFDEVSSFDDWFKKLVKFFCRIERCKVSDFLKVMTPEFRDFMIEEYDRLDWILSTLREEEAEDEEDEGDED
jgi:hypothetical protein